MATASSSCVGRNVSRNGPSVSTPTSGAPGQSQPMVVVWEWQDDLGVWLPYSGQVSGYIEQCFSSPRGHKSGGPGSTSIWLGQSDPSLSPYLIDIPSLKQFRQDTGKTRSVRRQLFAQSSGLGSGVYWEWVNDEGGWTPYETRISILLEHSYQARQATADIVSHGYNYIVDLTALDQVNKATGYRRQVRRQGNLPYPLASGASVIHSGPACSCQQCLSHSSTGPMSSRSRHSFSSGQLSRPSLQVPSRATGAHPTSVYSPYTRRPLSVGGMAWGGPWPLAPSASQLPGAQLALSTSANGLSIPAIPVQLNGSTSVSSALAGMASILMSAVGLGVRFMSAPSSAPPPPAAAAGPRAPKVAARLGGKRGSTGQSRPRNQRMSFTATWRKWPLLKTRTASSVWTGCLVRRIMTWRLREPSPSSLAPWASSSVDTPSTCSACWPCTTMVPRMAASSAPHARPSMGRRLGPSPRGRWRSIVSPSPSLATLTVELSRSYTTSPMGYRVQSTLIPGSRIPLEASLASASSQTTKRAERCWSC
ncbi:probable E3 ubiquitin-protein ligase DTX2 isoform X2 [Oncorhynchus tshawytscha]|uniref:probable E3 ubiquitin-protein ligase DTX2 isoform X2 n=1 Tax=Oncorhynchus tshawytscha TaxID=74940 RepID=UPI001C3C69DF|nr:probable E3 ubiquitin-protein ligase DTX2 isoform X2 [Oncorhynchus tshawytscha]